MDGNKIDRGNVHAVIHNTYYKVTYWVYITTIIINNLESSMTGLLRRLYF